MILSVPDVAELLGCSPEIVVERIAAGDIPALRFGRSWVVPQDALRERLTEIALAEARARKTPAPAPKRAAARVPPPLPSLAALPSRRP